MSLDLMDHNKVLYYQAPNTFRNYSSKSISTWRNEVCCGIYFYNTISFCSISSSSIGYIICFQICSSIITYTTIPRVHLIPLEHQSTLATSATLCCHIPDGADTGISQYLSQSTMTIGTGIPVGSC